MKLPIWDLSDLYKNIEDPQFYQDFKMCKEASKIFQQTYEGKIHTVDVAFMLSEYEALQEKIGKIGSFAALLYQKSMNDPKVVAFYQKTEEDLTRLSDHFIFLKLELNQIDTFQNPGRYAPWIAKIRKFKDHQLSKEMESLFLEKSLTAHASWIRLHDETLDRLRFVYRDENLTLAEVTDKISDKDPTVRWDAARSFSKGLETVLPILTLAMNTLLKDKSIEDRWRHFSSPIHERNLDNEIESESVEALVHAVRSAYPRLSHRYYRLKAELLGKDKLAYWDRNAPLPFSNDRFIPFDEAKEIVLSAFREFHPNMAEIAKEFFDKHWIDAEVVSGKNSGAFAHPCVPSVHPYVLLNYQGKIRDVMTLAHELGHGVHQVLAGKTQGYLLSDTPLTLAETASVFAEMLTFQFLMLRAQSLDEKRYLLATKIDDKLNTVVRQIAFHRFEEEIHRLRSERELTEIDFGDLWIETQKEALGDAVDLDPLVRPYWSYISHFVHVPFYVYAYAFGDALVNSLYACYVSNPSGFSEKYLHLLSQGGVQGYCELLSPFSLNPKDSSFWNQGLQIIEDLINQLEALS